MKEKAKIDICYELSTINSARAIGEPGKSVVSRDTFELKDVVVDKPVADNEAGALVIHYEDSEGSGVRRHLVMSYLNGALEFTSKALKVLGIDSRSVDNSKGYDSMTLSEVSNALESKGARLSKMTRSAAVARQRSKVARHLRWVNMLISHKPMWLYAVAEEAKIVVLHTGPYKAGSSSKIFCMAYTSGRKKDTMPVRSQPSASDEKGLPLFEYGQSPIRGAIKNMKMAQIAADAAVSMQASTGRDEYRKPEERQESKSSAARDSLFEEIYDLFRLMERMFENFDVKTMDLPPLKGLNESHHQAAMCLGWGVVKRYPEVVKGGAIHIDDVVVVRAAVESHLALRRSLARHSKPQ